MPIIKKGVQYLSEIGNYHCVKMLPKTIGDALVAATTPEGGTSPFTIVDYATPTQADNVNSGYTNFYCRLRWKSDISAYLYIWASADLTIRYAMTDIASGVANPSYYGTATTSSASSNIGIVNFITAYNNESCVFSLLTYNVTSLINISSNYIAWFKYEDTSAVTETTGYYHKIKPSGYELTLNVTTVTAYIYQTNLYPFSTYPPVISDTAYIMPYYLSSSAVTTSSVYNCNLIDIRLRGCYYIQGGGTLETVCARSIGIYDYIKINNLLMRIDT